MESEAINKLSQRLAQNFFNNASNIIYKNKSDRTPISYRSETKCLYEKVCISNKGDGVRILNF